MIQRAIGVTLGAVVTLILLILFAGGDQTQAYLAAVIIGGLVAFLWPIAIGWWLGRRARARQQDHIEAEVQRQLNDERRR
jgi:uncharacterized membrane protein YfbV (UPF0208 family)